MASSPNWFANTFDPRYARSQIESIVTASIPDVIQEIASTGTLPVFLHADLVVAHDPREKVQILFRNLDSCPGDAPLVATFQQGLLKRGGVNHVLKQWLQSRAELEAPSAARNLNQTPFTPSPTTSAATPVTVDDIRAALERYNLAREEKKRLDWQDSIVDLLKLIHRDSGMPARRRLALTLGVVTTPDDYKGTAPQNIALHRGVIARMVRDATAARQNQATESTTAAESSNSCGIA
ncbi:hypothetical protein C8F01DRAFT_369184 [Mycena amicta]|nr:hypothetical protein C8F01DRAFT_369184 [Mycena amicta]